MENAELKVWLIVWAVSVIIYCIIFYNRRIPSVGLVFSYIFTMTFANFFGALIYTLPWYKGLDLFATKAGFIETTQGLIAFIIGSIWGTEIIRRSFKLRWLKSKEYVPNKYLPAAYILAALFIQFFIPSVAKDIPSIGTLAASTGPLIITGLGLAAFVAWKENKPLKILLYILFSMIYPLLGMISNGFLGLGAVLSAQLVIFINTFYKPRWLALMGVIFIFLFGVSLAVTYLIHRNEIRRVVWITKEDLGTRARTVADSISQFGLLDLHDNAQLRCIDWRLNQNLLIGRAVRSFEQGKVEFAGGRTIMDVFPALVPRIIWPDKPIKTGGTSTEYVRKYTGMEIIGNTAVGMGQVFELYINFGHKGVLIGLFLWGTILGLLDIAAAQRLWAGNWDSFVLFYLLGWNMNKQEGTFAECVMCGGMFLVLVFVINKIIPFFLVLKRRRVMV